MRLFVLGSSSSGNGYLLTNGKETLIIEMGMPFKEVKKVLDFDISSIVGAVCSHTHGDHFHYHKEYEQAGIDLFTPWKYDKDVALFGGFRIQAFPVVHDVPTFGFYITHKEIGKLLFITDTCYVRQNFANLNVNHIIVECNYQREYVSEDAIKRDRVYQTHMELETCKEFINANMTDSLKTVVLCHLSDSSADSEEILADVRKIVHKGCDVEIAIKGLEIEL